MMLSVSAATFSDLPNQGIEVGNQTASANCVAAPKRLVLASYNIRYAVGRYLIASGLLRKIGLNVPRNRGAAVARNAVRAAQAFTGNLLLPRPDILALQEADKATGRAGCQHVAARVAEAMKMAYVHVSAGLPRGVAPKQREWWLNFEEQVAATDQGDVGVALLSRLPLTDIRRIDLPWDECPWRPRLAMAATVDAGDRALRLFNVHIDPHGPLHNQHQQTETVLKQAADHRGPVVIMGDFNTLSKTKASEIRSLMEAHGYETPFSNDVPTWRGAGIVRFHADWIFAQGVEFERWGVAKPLNVSDHWPIWAEIKL